MRRNKDKSLDQEARARVKERDQDPFRPFLTPDENKAAEDAITELYLKGHTSSYQIADELDLPMALVRRTIHKAQLLPRVEKIQSQITKEVFEDKVPILKDIVDRTLVGVRDFLMTEEAKPTTIQEARQLASLASELNEMTRLELGQTTSNVAVVQMSLKEVQDIFTNLKKIDPVFVYPELEGSEDVISES